MAGISRAQVMAVMVASSLEDCVAGHIRLVTSLLPRLQEEPWKYLDSMAGGVVMLAVLLGPTRTILATQ